MVDVPFSSAERRGASWVFTFTVVAGLFTAVPVQAQSGEPEPVGQAGAPSPFATSPTAAPPMTPAVQDGPRFRFGISGGGGGEFVEGLNAWMVGVDARIGLQINDLIGVYVQPHLSFGRFPAAASGGVPLSGSTGTFAFAAMVDFTLNDLLVFGAGAGYGVLNNPSGPMLAARVGAYPIRGRTEGTSRRKGLVVSAEMRAIFTGSITGVQAMAMVGYEAY